MKNFISKYSYPFLVISIMIGLCLTAINAWGQNNEKKQKQKARISLEYFHTSEEPPLLKATVKTRVNKVYETVAGVNVQFYLDGEDGKKKLGETLTNEEGVAELALDMELASEKDSITSHLFLAEMEENENFQKADRDLEIIVSQMYLELEEMDSTKLIRVFFGAPDSSGHIAPLEDINVKFFIKRLFGALPFGDDYEMTDEEGVVSVMLPEDIPGDRSGNLTIIAQTEEDEYGMRRVEKTVPWGVPLVSDHNEWERTLWSARKNTPLSLVIIINGMILGIWGVIVYIITQLVKIRKLGRDTLD